MNETIINNFNSKVEKHDQVIFLGDFCFGNPEPFLEKLNGDIVFLQGNHERGNRSVKTNITHLVLEIGNKEFYCTHKPEEYSSSYSINLVAHVHSNWQIKRIYNSYLINCGVDVWDYSPTSLEQILERLEIYKYNDKKSLNI